jgi:uncharacterized protein (UPF0216 family)
LGGKKTGNGRAGEYVAFLHGFRACKRREKIQRGYKKVFVSVFMGFERMATNKAMSPAMSQLLKSIGAEWRRKAGKESEALSVANRLNRKRRQLEELEKKEKYFVTNLVCNPKFENGKEFKDLQRILPDLSVKYKRLVVVILTLKEFLKQNDIADVYKLDKNILHTVLDCYIDDLYILKKRCGSQKIQLPKIAGLMTNLIVKYRPIVPVDIKNNPHSSINEAFAIYHSLCVCSDFSNGRELQEFGKTEQHDEFFENMKYLLTRNFTPESLIMIYRTLCLYQFQKKKKKEVDG